jgi:hypothetical protein
MQVTLTFDLNTVVGEQLLAQLQALLKPGPTLGSIPLGPVPLKDHPAVAATPVVPVVPDLPDLPADKTKADTVLANRQAAAAKARAAKDAKKAAGPAQAQAAPTAVAAPELNGADPLADSDPLEFPEAASMSPGEARDAGLALVRQAYAAGRVAEVKALQKQWQVAKFYDIAVEQGHAFYAQAMKLAQAAGLQR